MSNTEDKMRWFVVQTASGYEARVQKTLIEQIKRNGFEDRFEEVLIPTEEVVEVKGHVKKKSERKFFPGYILVKMIMDDETWHLVKDTNHVQGFLGGKKEKPTPLSEAEVQGIFDKINKGDDKPKPKTSYDIGEKIRVCDGPFKEYTGLIEKVDYEKSIVTVAVSIFGRQTPVDLEFSQVEKC